MKYLIIGLGHYGATLATELAAMGHEVVGVDGNGLHVDSVKDRMAASFVLDATDEMALSVLPLKSVDAVIVAIGDNFGASVRIVSLLKKLKVKRIYARAVDEVHKAVLEAFPLTVSLLRSRMRQGCWRSSWNWMVGPNFPDRRQYLRVQAGNSGETGGLSHQ